MTHATTLWGFSPLTGRINFKHEYLSNHEELCGMPYINGNISTIRNHQKYPSLKFPCKIGVAAGVAWVDINDNQ